MRFETNRPVPYWLIAMLVLVFLGIRGHILFTAIPSFGTCDMDKLIMWTAREATGAHPIVAAVQDLVRFDLGESIGGHRVVLALCELSGVMLNPHYLWIKAWALLWSAATMAAFLWAFRGSVSKTTSALVAAFLIFAPIRLLGQSNTLLGNHAESVLFIPVSLGFAIRACSAAQLRRHGRRDRMLLCMGICTGVAIYFIPTMLLWSASLLTMLVLFRPAHSLRDATRASASFVVGLVPGGFLIWKTYWPDKFDSMFPYAVEGRYSHPLSELFGAPSLGWLHEFWGRTIVTTPDHQGMLAFLGGSMWWLLIPVLLVLLRRRSLTLAVSALTLYVFIALDAAYVTGLSAPRHLISLVAITVVLQALVLGELLPWLGTRFVNNRVAARTFQVAGATIALALLAPRMQDAVALSGRHSYRDALEYDARIITAFDGNAVDIEYMEPLRRKLAEVRDARLPSEERRFILHGIRTVFEGGEYFQLDESLPMHLMQGVERNALLRRADEQEAFIADNPFEEGQLEGLSPEDAREFYLCGTDLAREAIVEAGPVRQMPGPHPSILATAYAKER